MLQTWLRWSDLYSRRWSCLNSRLVGWQVQEYGGWTCCQGLERVTNTLEWVDGNMERPRGDLEIESTSSSCEVRDKEFVVGCYRIKVGTGFELIP